MVKGGQMAGKTKTGWRRLAGTASRRFPLSVFRPPFSLHLPPSTFHLPRNRRGSGLIVAIWVIALLSILVVSFAFDAHLETQVLSVTRKGHQAEYLAKSGITIAEMLMDKSGSISGNEAPEAVSDDRWYPPALQLFQNNPIVGLVEKLGEGYIRLDIEPEPGRRNVNMLTDDDWERILQVGGVPEELWPTLIDSFNDWKDTDDIPRANGAETDDYYATLTPPYRARNGPVDTVRELLLVKGFNETILSGGVLNPDAPPDQRKVLSGIQDMLTANGTDNKVNVNAAGLRVLMTLPKVDDLVAHAIIEERARQVSEGANGISRTGFSSGPDFMSRIPGLDPTVANMVETHSSTFRVTSIGQVGRVTRRIWAIIIYSGKKFTILQWREET
jgi:general secretion pathway protein K